LAMIRGTPRVVERDGQRELVDDNEDLLVCRISGERRGGRIYHRVDCSAFETDGRARPACDFEGREATWRLKRRDDLADIYRGCTYGECFGEFSGPHQCHQAQYLATRLKEMTVDEFEQVRGQR
jgi:hypothetical protein